MPSTFSVASVSSSVVTKLLSKCRFLSDVKQLHGHLLILRSHHRPFPYNDFLSKLLSLCPNSSSVATTSSATDASNYVLLLRSSHPAPTALSYNVSIRFFASVRPRTSLRLFLLMLCPDAYTLPFLLLAAARRPAPSLARSARALLEKLGVGNHDHTVHSLITMYSDLGDPRTARRVFDGIPHRDVISWNAMMKAYEQVGMAAGVALMFRAMVAEGAVAPNAVTVAVVLTACRDARDLVLGRWVEEWVKSTGMEVGSLVGCMRREVRGDGGSTARV